MKKIKNFAILFVVFAMLFSAVLFPAKMPVSVHATTPVTNLTNTEWVFNETIDLSGDFEYCVEYIFDYGGSYETIMLDGNGEKARIIVNAEELNFTNGSATQDYWPILNGSWDGHWAECQPHIYFTGGDDVTNANFITWLYENAQLQENGGTDTGIAASIVLPTILVVTFGTVTAIYLLTFKRKKRI